jgi:RNA polymerase sigma-70 factor (ECF subfamily)
MQQIHNDQDLPLIEAAKNGNKNAFGSLVLKYQHRILKLINRYIRDPSESLDVVQEIFIKAYRGLDNFKQKSSFYTWLYKISINTAKSYLIDQNRCLPKYSFDTIENEHLYYIMLKDPYKEYDNPDNKISCHELENLFFRIVNKLSPELKETILLREVDELTYEEIATVMCCPIGTVRSRIFRAREAIEKRINAAS